MHIITVPTLQNVPFALSRIWWSDGYHANESWRLALLEYLATPLDSNIPSPSELNGRQFSGLLPNLRCNSLPDSTSEALIDRHKKQLNRAHGKELRDLPEGSTVLYYDHTSKCWRTSLVQERKVTSLLMIEAYLFPEIEWGLRPTNNFGESQIYV